MCILDVNWTGLNFIVQSCPLQKKLAEVGWDNADNATRDDVEKAFHCCGFRNATESATCSANCPTCPTCEDQLETMINYGFRVSGGIGLFFSFTEVWV